ncbi:MAG TPA: methyl-accepting chemotaxis protein [Spirochaetota bacterium]|nr:methyl-accepting chemotaxis protein [Spirochaetota bacterium]
MNMRSAKNNKIKKEKKKEKEKKNKSRYISIKTKVYSYFFITITLLVLISGFIFYARYSNIIEHSIKNTLTVAANLLKITLTHSKYLDNDIFYSYENEEFKKLWNDIKIIQKETSITYIYIMEKRDDNKFYFIFDSGEVNNDLNSALEDTYFKEYEECPQEVYEAYDSRNIVYTKGTITDRWGTYKSVFVPVIDNKGRIFVVGVDIRIDYITKEKNISLLFILVIFLIAILLSFLLTLVIKINVLTPLEKLKKKSEYLTSGDLTIDFIVQKNRDEIFDLSMAFNNTISTLKELISKVFIAIVVLTKNLKKLFKSSTSVAESANFQASTVEQTQRNVENLNKMVETISIESQKANNYTDQALKKAREGMTSMERLEEEMIKIEESSKEITNIIEMINDIAEQTNLLSLNASIESARAGEAGKGFNIVAGEIRKLAEKSTSAANRIQELINNNNKIIQEGVKFSKNTLNTLKEISMANELITGIVRSITREVQQVKNNSKEILDAISHIANIAQNNLIESEKVSEAMNDFVIQTVELQKFVGQFDVRSKEIKDNQKHVEEILKAKLIEVGNYFKKFGPSFISTDKKIKIKDVVVNELRIGNLVITGNNELADTLSKLTNTAVTFFQVVDESIMRVATTVKNFDDSRAIGTFITSESQVYKSVIKGEDYFGRAFVVNRWYIAVYKPIIEVTGKVLGALYLGIPEMIEGTEKIEFDDDSIVKDITFKN